MKNQAEQQWIADNDEKSQARESLIVPSPPTESIDQLDIEVIQPQNIEPQSIMPKQSLLQLQKYKFKESICIDDSNITMIMFIGKKMQLQGRLKVTNIHLSFIFKGKHDQDQIFFEMPIGYISRCERLTDDRLSTIEIWLKYGCSLKIRYTQNKYQICAKTYQIISKLIETSTKFALEYAANVTSDLLCQRFTSKSDIATAYQYDNDNWKRYPNYPQKFLVPLSYLSKNNGEERMVGFCFSYINGKSKIGFWRTGPGRPDPSQDQWIMKSRIPATRSYTLQIKNKGIGTSKSLCSKAIELETSNQIRESFSNTFRITYHNHQSLNWLTNFNQTKWLDQIANILQQASLLVEKIVKEETQMITLVADNDTRGAQIAALTQLLLFPQLRSIKGFGRLLEAEFLQWGVQKMNKKEAQMDKGPIIIQFLDAVYQLTCIYPLSFEFNQNFLVFIAENIYSNKFGNFLMVSKYIKQEQRQILFKSCSIWSILELEIKDPLICSQYSNPFYVDFKECDIYELRQFPSCKYLRIWGGFFFKKFKDKNIDYQICQRYQNIFIEHFKNKLKTEQLRLQLSEQHKVLMQRKALLSDLKALQ